MPPVVVSSVITGSTLVSTMSEPLLPDAIPDTGDATVWVDGVPASIVGIQITGTLVTVELVSDVGLASTVTWDYTNPAQVIPPAAPGQNYSIPGGATSVTNGTELQTALDTWQNPIDIVLEDGTYDKATNFVASHGHRLYGRNVLDAVLVAGLDMGSNGVRAGGEVHGLMFNVTDAAKDTINGAMLANWEGGGGANSVTGWLVEDCAFDGGASRVPHFAVECRAPSGSAFRRLHIRNVQNYGVYASNYPTATDSTIVAVEDIDAANVYRTLRGNSDGTGEAAVWIGNEVTSAGRWLIRNCGWMGFTLNHRSKNTIVYDTDVDECYGIVPTAGVGSSPGTGETGMAFYPERRTENMAIERFRYGPDIYNAVNGEWNGGTPGNAAMNGFVARHGRVTTSRQTTPQNNRGIYSDAGGRDISVHDVVFEDCEHSCIGVNVDDSGETTITDMHHNDYSQRAADCARVTWDHALTYPATEMLSSEGEGPRRLLSAASTRDDVASFTGQAVSVLAPPPPTVGRSTVRRTLGCGEYQAWITARGGRRLLDTVPWTSLSWARELDDTSEATLDALVGEDCCLILAETRPWRHELLIVRDGYRVWEGPLISSTIPPEEPKLTARDLTAWWDHRLVHDDHAYDDVEIAEIFEAISADAMDPDNTPRLFLTTTPTGILGDLDVKAAQHKLAGPLLRDLTKSGIDWTVVGRDVLAGGVVIPTTSIGPFLTEHFIERPTVKLDGARQANRWVVAGAGGGEDGDPIFGDAADANARAADGLLEATESVSTIQDNTVAQAGADQRVALTANEVVLIENAILHPDAPFPIETLIPGALCQLDLETCVPAVGYYRLKSIKVTRDADAETVALAFQPQGSLV